MERARVAGILREHGPALALYGLLFVLAGAAGYPMTIHWEWFQILDRPLLEDRLVESLLALHAQPPLLNLGLGLALKLARATGGAPEPLLLAVQLVVGAVAVVALGVIARRLLGPGPLARVLLVLVVLEPMLYVSLREWFYTGHELALLAVAAVLARRFLERGETRAFAGVAAVLVLLSYERSLFHPLFSAAGLLLLLFARGATAAQERPASGPRLAVLGVSAAVLAAWPVKNLLLIGVLSTSSWQGFNLADGLYVPHPRLAALFMLAEVDDRAALERQADALVPDRLRDVPAISRLYKADGAPNWNHAAMVAVSRELQRRSFEVMRTHPSRLARKVAAGYFRGYATFAGHEPWFVQGPVARLWLRAYETLVFLYPGTDVDEAPISGFTILIPAALALVAVRLRREWRSDPLGTRTAALLLYPVLWVLAMVLLVEGAEGSRIRLSTEPFVFLLAAWGVAGLGRRAVRQPAASASPSRPASRSTSATSL